MRIDLEKMSREELLELRAKVDATIDGLKEKERVTALKAAEEAAASHGFTLAELGVAAKGKARGKGKSATKAAPKYRDPDDPSKTWTGKGRRPEWFKAAEAAGIPLSKLEI